MQSDSYFKAPDHVYKNIEKFDLKHLSNFNQIIRENKHYKLTLPELIEKMSYFHIFTEESLLHMIKTINQWPRTYNGYGPYVFKDGYWKCLNTEKTPHEKEIMEYVNKIDSLSEEIKQLNEKIRILESTN